MSEKWYLSDNKIKAGSKYVTLEFFPEVNKLKVTKWGDKDKGEKPVNIIIDMYALQNSKDLFKEIIKQVPDRD